MIIDELSLLEKESAKFIVNKEDDYLYQILGTPFTQQEISNLVDHKNEIHQIFIEADCWDSINNRYPIIASFVTSDEYNASTMVDKNKTIKTIYNILKEIYQNSGSENRFIGIGTPVDILPDIFIKEPVNNQRLYNAIILQRGERLSVMRGNLAKYLIYLIIKTFRENSLLKNDNVFMNFHYNRKLNNEVENSICDILFNFFSKKGSGNKYNLSDEITGRLSFDGLDKAIQLLSDEINKLYFPIEKEQFFSAIHSLLTNDIYKQILYLFEKINKLKNDSEENLSQESIAKFIDNFIDGGLIKINDEDNPTIKRKTSYKYFNEIQLKLTLQLKGTAEAARFRKSDQKTISTYKNFLLCLSSHLYKTITNVIEAKFSNIEKVYNIFVAYDIDYENRDNSAQKEIIRNKMNSLDRRLAQIKQLKRVARNYLELGKEVGNLQNHEVFVDESLSFSFKEETLNVKFLRYLQLIENAFLQFRQVNDEDVKDCLKIISIYKETLVEFPVLLANEVKKKNKTNTIESQSANLSLKPVFSLNFFGLKKPDLTKEKTQPKSARSYGDRNDANRKTSNILDENASSYSNANHVMFNVTQLNLDEALKNIKKNDEIKATASYLDMQNEKRTITTAAFFQAEKDTVQDGYHSDTTIYKRKATLSPRPALIYTP